MIELIIGLYYFRGRKKREIMTHRSQINMLNEKQSSEQTILSESADVHKEKKPFTKRDHDIAVVFEASQEEVIELFESVAALMYSFDDLGISS